jgi:hypothetical protein
MEEELATWAEFQDKVKLSRGLECVSQLDNERMTHIFLKKKLILMIWFS